MLAGNMSTPMEPPPWAVLLQHPTAVSAAPAPATEPRQLGWWETPGQPQTGKTKGGRQTQPSKRAKTSQYRGVASTENGLWRCRIRFGKQTVHLGRFNDERDAALAYDRAASLLLGNSAKLNFEGRCPASDDDPVALAATATVIFQALGADAPPDIQQLAQAGNNGPGIPAVSDGSTGAAKVDAAPAAPPAAADPKEKVQQQVVHAPPPPQQQQQQQGGQDQQPDVQAADQTQLPPAQQLQAWAGTQQSQQQQQQSQAQKWQMPPPQAQQPQQKAAASPQANPKALLCQPAHLDHEHHQQDQDSPDQDQEQQEWAQLGAALGAAVLAFTQPPPDEYPHVVSHHGLGVTLQGRPSTVTDWPPQLLSCEEEVEQQRCVAAATEFGPHWQQLQQAAAARGGGGACLQGAAAPAWGPAAAAAQFGAEWAAGGAQGWGPQAPLSQQLLGRRQNASPCHASQLRGAARGGTGEVGGVETVSSAFVSSSSDEEGSSGGTGDEEMEDEHSWDSRSQQQRQSNPEYVAAMEQLGRLLETDPQLMLWSLMHACKKDAPPRGRHAQRSWHAKAEQRATTIAAVSALIAANTRRRASRPVGGGRGSSNSRRRRHSESMVGARDDAACTQRAASASAAARYPNQLCMPWDASGAAAAAAASAPVSDAGVLMGPGGPPVSQMMLSQQFPGMQLPGQSLLAAAALQQGMGAN